VLNELAEPGGTPKEGIGVSWTSKEGVGCASMKACVEVGCVSKVVAGITGAPNAGAEVAQPRVGAEVINLPKVGGMLKLGVDIEGSENGVGDKTDAPPKFNIL
jgi:hypothetical protein